MTNSTINVYKIKICAGAISHAGINNIR